MRQTFSFIAVLVLVSLGVVQNGVGQWVKADIASGDQPLCFFQNGSNLYAGMADSGVYLSTDDGGSWSPVGLKGIQIHALASTGANLIAGTSDQIGDGAVYFSTNNGTTWTKSVNGPSTAVLSLAVHGITLFAGTATGSGVYTTSNNGATWKTEPTTGTATTGAATIQALAVIGSDVFAGTDQGMFLSSNNGTSWSAINTGLSAGADINSLVVSGTDLFAGIYYSGVYRTSNNGTSWSAVNSGLTNTNALTLTTFGTNELVGVGTDSGIFLTNNGTSWTSLSSVTGRTGAPDSNAYFIAAAGSYLYCQTYRTVSALWRLPILDIVLVGAVNGISDAEDQSATAYPNPFIGSTNISFSSHAQGAAGVTVVNLLGEEVARIYSGELTAGEHSFRWNAQNLTAGTYFCVVRSGGETFTIPIALAR